MPVMSVANARLYFENEYTPVSRDFNDVYFSRTNGLEESRYVFLHGNQLPERFIHHPRALLVVAEAGFGSGLNFLALWQAFDQFRLAHPLACLQRLHMISFEKYPLTLADLQRIHHCWPELAHWSAQLQQQWPLAQAGCHRLLFANGKVTLDLWFADVNDALRQPDASLCQQADAWFLDGFAPAKNPAMWSDQLFQAMAILTRAGGTVATFSAAKVVRCGLQQAGFIVQKAKGFAGKRDMLTARLPQETSVTPSYPYWQRLAASRNGQVAIIGGGIASVLLAQALLRRDIPVTLYCADAGPAQGASGNRQGVLYPLLNQHDKALSVYFRAAFGFARRLYDALPLEVERDWCGVIQLYDAKKQKKINQLLADGVPQALARRLNASQASAVCGLPVPHAAIEYPSGGWINPAQLTCVLLELAQQQGLQIHYQYQAVALHYQQPQDLTKYGWRIQFSNKQVRQHPVLVLANGWQIGQFAQTAELPVTPAAGQVSHIPTDLTLMNLRRVLCYDGYLTPCNLATHSHCMGASYRQRQTDTGYRQQDQQENHQRLMDALAGEPWSQQLDLSANEGRCGVRCMVRDHLPLVGNAPDHPAMLALYSRQHGQSTAPATIPAGPYHPDLFIFAALGSRGLCSAPLAAEVLAAQLCGEPQPLDTDTLNALNPNRLWIRKLMKGRPVRTESVSAVLKQAHYYYQKTP